MLGSPAMGRPVDEGAVLPRTTSPLGDALRVLSDWSVERLCREAQRLVRDDDAGLVAVAAASGDAVACWVAREAVALTGALELADVEEPRFAWAVSDGVATVARRFISALRQATGIALPAPAPESASAYGLAARDADIAGRCIVMGERSGDPCPYYHWYVDAVPGGHVVKEFWSSALWTTEAVRRTPTGPQARQRGARAAAGRGPGAARRRWRPDAGPADELGPSGVSSRALSPSARPPGSLPATP